MAWQRHPIGWPITREGLKPCLGPTVPASARLKVVSILTSVVRRVFRAYLQRPNGQNGGERPQPKGVRTMRFIVLVKANKDSEAGALPDSKMLESMGRFNEELVKAGVLLAAE